jgi:hypothetical protein
LHDTGRRQRRDEADDSHQRDSHRLRQHHAHHAAHGRAKYHAYADLAATLTDDVRYDALDADGAEDDRDSSGDREQRHGE